MDKDVELADLFDVKPNTISAWRKRNSIDYELLFTKCADLNFNWLVFGDGPMYKDELAGNRVHSSHQEYEIRTEEQFEQFSIELINRIERAPFSRNAKLYMIDSLVRIVGSDIDEMRRQGTSDSGTQK